MSLCFIDTQIFDSCLVNNSLTTCEKKYFNDIYSNVDKTQSDNNKLINFINNIKYHKSIIFISVDNSMLIVGAYLMYNYNLFEIYHCRLAKTICITKTSNVFYAQQNNNGFNINGLRHYLRNSMKINMRKFLYDLMTPIRNELAQHPRLLLSD